MLDLAIIGGGPAGLTAGLYATDRPELFKAQTQNELMFELNFWDKPKT